MAVTRRRIRHSDGLGHRWVDGVKIHELLTRRGVRVPLRTVQRYVCDECGRHRGRGPTVRVADGEPGDELQVDFGRMGHLDVDGRRRVVWALVFTASYSRHCFVWLSHRQTMGDVIDGRMLERGTENTIVQPALPGTVVAGRFARDPDHFAVRAGGER